MMRKIQRDDAAVSEVIGAMMLTLIVVIAASSFAVFIAEKQSIEQDSQILEAKKDAEKLTVINVDPETGSGFWTSFNFTVTSYHAEISEIRQVSVNDAVARNYNVTRYDESTGSLVRTSMNYVQTIVVAPGETIYLNVTVGDLFIEPMIPTDYNIMLSLQTNFDNLFEETFVTPCPLIKVVTESYWNGAISDFEEYLVLDGSSSYQEGDGNIVKWVWNATLSGTTVLHDTLGQKIRFDMALPGDYTIRLTVTNGYGMQKEVSLIYSYA
ncbi:MAG: type IV pilin [Methanomassiliicoccales archaeon]|jgi:FlaG/FlaF family flagellin (archaellin)